MMLMDCGRLKTSKGSMRFSSSWPASYARHMVLSISYSHFILCFTMRQCVAEHDSRDTLGMHL